MWRGIGTKGFGTGEGFEWLRTLAAGNLGGVPMPFVIMVVLAAAAWVLVHRSVRPAPVRRGQQRRGCPLPGVETRRVIASAYVVAGTLTAVSAVLIAFYTNSGHRRRTATSRALCVTRATAAARSLRGGEGTILGIVLGTALLQVLRNLVNLLDVPSSLDFDGDGRRDPDRCRRGRGVRAQERGEEVIQRRERPRGAAGDRSRRVLDATWPTIRRDEHARASTIRAANHLGAVWHGRQHTGGTLYTTNKRGLIAKITNYGIVTELHVPDRADGSPTSCSASRRSTATSRRHHFGAIVGRVANRIGNAAFTLEGKRYTLAANDAPHHLHGGRKGWDKVVWSYVMADTALGPALELTYISNDGEEATRRRYGEDRLHAHQRQRAQGRDAGHDRCAHTRQHGAPQLLESRRPTREPSSITS